jgi:hypothetical protein
MIIVYVAGFLANLPTFIVVHLFYILPMQLLNQLEHANSHADFSPESITFWYQPVSGSWFNERFKYGGLSLGPHVVIRRGLTSGQLLRIQKHEEMHVIQGCIQGTLWPVLFVAALLAHPSEPWWAWFCLVPVVLATHPVSYGLASVFIWLFLKKKHAYYDNPYERQARARAGQEVNIHPDDWIDGSDDRWIWWLFVLALPVIKPAVGMVVTMV